jgi:hypothetical protein
VQSSQVLLAAKDCHYKLLVLAELSSRKEGHLHLFCTFTRITCKHAVYSTQMLRKATIDCNHSAAPVPGEARRALCGYGRVMRRSPVCNMRPWQVTAAARFRHRKYKSHRQGSFFTVLSVW